MTKTDKVTRNFRVACIGLIAIGFVTFAVGMFLK